MSSTDSIPQPTLLGGAEGSCEVLLIRHGRSADVVPGTPEAADPALHEIGLAQAAALARRLDGKVIHAVYASQLRRAVETAGALAGPRGLAVEVRPDLQEVLLGEWGNGEFRRRAAVLDPEWVAWARTGRWDGVPGGESDATLRARVAGAVQELAERHGGQSIAVVVHAGVINAYLAEVLGMARSIWLTVENTSVTVVHVEADRQHVVVANDCHHLYDPVVGPGVPG